jgi:hypothetical protein
VRPPARFAIAVVEELLRRLYLGAAEAPGGSSPGDAAPGLRDEDRKKAREVAALVGELARFGRRGLVVDAAAGHGYVGLCAAELIGLDRLVVLERSEARAERCRLAAARLRPLRPLSLDVRTGDVADPALWPERPDVVVALHACGAASDAILDGAVAARARWLLLLPCCHDGALRFAAPAAAHAEALGLARHGELRRRATRALIDGERVLRLEAAGYGVEVSSLVPPSVTPENLMLRARHVGEPRRMAEAREELRRLWGGRDGGGSPPWPWWPS